MDGKSRKMSEVIRMVEIATRVAMVAVEAQPGTEQEEEGQ